MESEREWICSRKAVYVRRWPVAASIRKGVDDRAAEVEVEWRRESVYDVIESGWDGGGKGTGERRLW